MKRILVSMAVLTVAMFGVTGCQTFAYSTAPAKAGFMYVSGSHNSKPMVWLCPDAPKKGECHEVVVTEDEGD